MLTEEEKREILKEVEHYPHPRAASVAALKILQQRRGWVSGDLAEVAALLGMTPAELEGLATFFSHIYLQPLGRHVIFICDSISCWVTGYDMLKEYLQDRLKIKLGETTSDGRFTLMPIACLGICDYAPAMMVDEVLYTGLNRMKIDDILEQYP